MKIKNHLLYHDNNKRVEWQETPNKRGHLVNQSPDFIIIHYTGGGSVESALSTFKNRDSQASAHLIIGQDGRIIQMGRFHERCWHAGISQWQGITGLNSRSVGIELVNWGWLTGGPGHWRSWTGTLVLDDKVVELAHKNEGLTRGWEIFSEEQMEKTIEVVRSLLKAYQLTPSSVLGHDDISPGRKQDPGPAFPFERFRNLLEGRDQEIKNEFENNQIEPIFRVIAQSGLNLRQGAGIEHDVLKTLPVGTHVIKLESHEHWWLVSELVKGHTNTTGWVYSRWLSPIP